MAEAGALVWRSRTYSRRESGHGPEVLVYQCSRTGRQEVKQNSSDPFLWFQNRHSGNIYQC